MTIRVSFEELREALRAVVGDLPGLDLGEPQFISTDGRFEEVLNVDFIEFPITRRAAAEPPPLEPPSAPTIPEYYPF